MREIKFKYYDKLNKIFIYQDSDFKNIYQETQDTFYDSYDEFWETDVDRMFPLINEEQFDCFISVSDNGIYNWVKIY